MYRDVKGKTLLKILAVLVIAAALFFGYRSFRKRADRDLSDESIAAIKQAIERAALQCYVVEGAYPVNLDYLKQYYGLTINENTYYVVYDAYAENQLPDIRVVRK
ncbi:MAG: hypothetical protein IJI46_09965 [Erysipelotrichaceae bacterium]|nr:hypothetical protein [Erysipelotrichaceae bacterium]